MKLRKAALAFLVVVMALVAAPMFAQDQGQPPSFAPDQLDQLVSRIALYPDPLLAQILAAATFPDRIPDAARWADQHHYLTGQALADHQQRALAAVMGQSARVRASLSWRTAIRAGRARAGAA